MPILQHDVVRLDIAVYDAIPMGVIERSRHFQRDYYGFVNGKHLLVIQSIAQRLPLDVRHDIVQGPGSLSGIEDWQDMWMRELRSELDLPDEPVRPDYLSDIWPQDL
jgi:hypothetical protein